ncbi:unnamed protein product [Colias eurytheme]|nr:unnamed protein product [Colias eurytheme]CAG4946030.1 unnamed protein product [Colias eurytheme]
MYENYSFSKKNELSNGKTRYCCSALYSKNCKMNVYLDKDNVVVEVKGSHDHEPLAYTETPLGYIRV